MSQLSMFIPLTKVDTAKRLVYGVVTAEAPDRGDEICDYASTKPHYQKWSAEFHKASGGKSLGNLRAMHGKVAAGRVEAIAFNDEAKQIEICAKIVDDLEWRKVEAGVYTGFSQGGAYVRRWPDAGDPQLTRYTASPSEISLVDLPSLPNATFSLVKLDGAVETVRFAPRPGANELEQVWMASDGKTFKKKAEALAHQIALSSMGPMFGALSRIESDVGAADKGPRQGRDVDRLTKFLGQEAIDAARAVAALEIVFEILRNEIGEGEESAEQIEALKDAIERLKTFIACELAEPDDEDEDADDDAMLEQSASTRDLAKRLEAAALERDAHKALLDQLTPRLERLAARIEEIGRQPLPPPMLPGTRAVEKGADGRNDDIVTALARMSGEERAALLIKVAQSQPAALR